MDTQAVLEKLKEIRSFFRVLHEEYDKAFQANDLLGIIKTSGELSAAYAVVGNTQLARKWTEEHRVSLCRLNLERMTSD